MANTRMTADTDATHLLAEDHRKVEDLFSQFEKASGKDKKEQIARRYENIAGSRHDRAEVLLKLEERHFTRIANPLGRGTSPQRPSLKLPMELDTRRYASGRKIEKPRLKIIDQPTVPAS